MRLHLQPTADGLKYECTSLTVRRSPPLHVRQNFWFTCALIFSMNFVIFRKYCKFRSTSISSAFVIVVRGSNFKYSLSINSKQKPNQLKIYAFIQRPTPHSVHISKNKTSLANWTHHHHSLSTHAKHIPEIHLHHYVWQLWLKFAGADSNRLHVMNQTEFKLKNNPEKRLGGCFSPSVLSFFHCCFCWPHFSFVFHLIFDVWVQVENC